MTLVVGILCSDGVVIASDSAITFGQTLGQQSATKVRQLGGASLLFGFSGPVGMAQVVGDHILTLYQNKNISHPAAPTSSAAMDVIGQAIAGKLRPYLQNASLIGQQAPNGVACVCVASYVFNGKPCLFHFGPTGAPAQEATDQLPFVALGSGQPIAAPFLAFVRRVLWNNGVPDLAAGRFAAAWTLTHVIQTNPGGVGPPIQMATLKLENNRVVVDDKYDPNEHEGAIREAEEALRAYFIRQPSVPVPIPKVQT